ncbi:MAG TPA: zf-TFIIB domain-containing protein [Caulifigura sp.]|nr:zf-TFIIB domain-containing protein [Caulifigura sp.]
MINCRNCGAPLPTDLENGRHVCEYCDTGTVPESDSRLLEEVVGLDRDAGIDCPVCRNRMTAALIDESSVAWCSGCRGLLFNDDVFATTVRSRRALYRESGRIPKPLDVRAYERKLNCSRCRRAMQVHPYYGPGNVVIDSCLPCRLVWVDAGELTRIEQAAGRR